MRTITYDDALHALNEAVASKGHDYIDIDAKKGMICRNIRQDGKGGWMPSCIVGTALVWLGVPVDWFIVTQSYSSSIYPLANKLREARLLYISDEAATLMAAAQNKQDQEATWGNAVAEAHLGYDAFWALPTPEVAA